MRSKFNSSVLAGLLGSPLRAPCGKRQGQRAPVILSHPEPECNSGLVTLRAPERDLGVRFPPPLQFLENRLELAGVLVPSRILRCQCATGWGLRKPVSR